MNDYVHVASWTRAIMLQELLSACAMLINNLINNLNMLINNLNLSHVNKYKQTL